jgi:ketosteroid isomerase-like protein
MHPRALLAVTVLLLALLAPNAYAEADELKNISQLIGRKQYSEAAASLDSYLSAHPQDIHGQFLKGVILSEQKNTAEATRIFSDLIAKHPSWPEPYNNLAVIYAGQGQYERARQTLELALRTHPSYAAIHDNLSGIYAAMASEAYGKALKTDAAARPQPRLAMVNLPYAEKRALAMAAGIQTEKPMPIKAATPAPIAKPIPAASVPATPVPVAKAPVVVAVAQPVAKPVAPQPAPVAPQPMTVDYSAAVEDAVKGWAKAWSRQDVDKYLDYYAASFKTPKGESRRAWEQTRRSRIKGTKSIDVVISGIQTKIDGDRAEVRFKQNYRADKVAKRTSKTLVLQKSNDRWLIVQELTSR